MTDQPFQPGDRVYVTDPALARLRAIMRDATGQEPAPNHHGTVADVWDSGSVLIHFDDGGGAPYPADEVRHLVKALTVQQPWAWAIVHGGKNVENRTQAWSYRGPLAIHAGLARPEKHNLASVEHRKAHGTEIPTELVFGAIVGVVDLVDAHLVETCLSADGLTCSAWAEKNYTEHSGRERRDVVHLVLANPRPLDAPIPCKGRLGLWTPPAAVLEQLQAASA